MNKISYLFIILIILFLHSCSTFSEFYKPLAEPENRGWHVIRLSDNEEPKISSSTDLINDAYEMLSNHYLLLGTTSFNGPADDILSDIQLQCLKIGATVALYSVDYTDTRYGTYYIGNKSYFYDIKRYDYSVYYFVKFTDNIGFGMDLADLNEKDRQNYKRNTGAFVSIVYKDSPAFYANIVRGDIIIGINNTVILNAVNCNNMINSLEKGNIVSIEILRNGKSEIIKVKYE